MRGARCLDRNIAETEGHASEQYSNEVAAETLQLDPNFILPATCILDEHVADGWARALALAARSQQLCAEVGPIGSGQSFTIARSEAKGCLLIERGQQRD